MKILPILLLIFLSACAVNRSNESVIKVKLRPVKTNDGPLGSTVIMLNDSIAVNNEIIDIAQKNQLDSFLYTQYSFDPEAYSYQQLKDGKIDSSYFNKVKMKLGIPDSFTIHTKYDAEIQFLIGKNRAGDYVVIADENNDNTLKNDPVHKFENWDKRFASAATSQQTSVRLDNLSASFVEQQEKFSMNFLMRPLKGSNVTINHVTPKLGINLTSSDYFTGKFKIRGKRYKIAVRNLLTKYRLDPINTIMVIERRNKPFRFQQTHDANELKYVGDSMSMEKGAIKIAGIAENGRFVTLKRIPEFDAQTRFDVFAFRDLVSRDTMDFSALLQDREYLIMDFWGSWCYPCIASFPKLKELNQRVSDKVAFVGIVYDKKDNLDKADSLLKRYHIAWPQAFVSQEMENTIVQSHNVVSFPTYFLLDRNGNIIYRDFGEDGLARMETKLKELLIP